MVAKSSTDCKIMRATDFSFSIIKLY
jgi:hypothetical protein